MILFFCDLSFDKKLDIFLPSIYVNSPSSKVGYVDKKASEDVLMSLDFNKETADDHINYLLTINNELRPENIFRKFDKNPNTKKTLAELLKDAKFGFLILKYINAKIDTFLKIVSENGVPLSINLSRDKDFYNSQVYSNAYPLDLKLKFEKNENGLQYTMWFLCNDVTFYPSEKQITILLNDPAWLVFDRKLFRISDVNCNKIKPFLTKKHIDVTHKNVPVFFDTFVKDIVKKVDIEAVGFDVVSKTSFVSCALSVEHNFFKGNYQFDLLFDYDGHVFKSSQSKTRHSTIGAFAIEDITVINFKRNVSQENEMVGILKDVFNLVQLPTGLFDFDERYLGNKFDNIEFLINNKAKLHDCGFQIAKIVLNNKIISNIVNEIRVETIVISDWFDIKFSVKCGVHIFYFADLLKNIKEKNPFFELPDGTFFLIPNEWFSKYASLVCFSVPSNKTLRLPKSNFAILEDLQIEKVVFDVKKSNLVYQPSIMLKTDLRPYQQDGVHWLLNHYNNKLGACLADDMGLGKTLQTLALLVAVQEDLTNVKDNFQMDLFVQNAIRKDFLNTLIILPTSLIFNWVNETKKFAPHFRILQYIGKDRKMWHKKLDRYDVIFTSYATAAKDIAILKNYHFNYAILDESQQIKNKESLTFKALSQIRAKNKLALSGTPVENSLSDLWAQMQFINPNVLGSYHFFVDHFKNPIEKHHNQKALEELKKIVSPFILRRTKAEVLKDLPILTEQVIYCDLSELQKKWYETEKSKARNELLHSGAKQNKLHVLNVLMQLRQLSNHPKMVDSLTTISSGKFVQVISYIETLLRANQKVLIFSSFTKHLSIYEKWCKDTNIVFCKITGATSISNREVEVDKFQNSEDVKLFFISLKTGGIGLNLTKASYVLLLDPWWNPFAEQQAVSRAHRIGQENKVHAVRFISKTTIEEKIMELQNRKKMLSDSILDIDQMPIETIDNLDFLLS